MLQFVQVYRGPNTRFNLESLEPNTEYYVRVCAVRETSDGAAIDIPGPFSSGAHFTTLAPEPSRRVTPARDTESKSSSLLAEPKQWSDQQWAAVILLCFVVLAVLFAFITQQFIAYLGYSTVVPSGLNTSTSPNR